MNKTIKFLTTYIFFLTNIYACLLSSTTILNDLYNPQYIVVDKKFLLIEDNLKIRMYSAENIKLIKTIGRKGEGPGEFIGYPYPQILHDSIMISSVGKISFFNFSGDLMNEQKTKLVTPFVKKLNNKYISHSIKIEKDDFYIQYNIYSSNFSKELTFYKGKWLLHRDGKRDLFEIYFFDVYNGKIVFALRKGFKIEILDKKGSILYTIEQPPKNIPFKHKDMENIFKYMDVHNKNKGFVRAMKRKCIKPKYFPEIRKCIVSDGKIYVVTYLKEKERSECIIFNMQGQQLKRTFIPLRVASPIARPPFTINNYELYQLVENVENEHWELVINKIE